EDYYGLTVSFSPKDRIPEARLRQGGYLQTLRNAGKAYPAHWPFLTGGDTAILALADSLGFRYRYDKESEQYEHPAVSMVLGPDGRISRYLYGVEFSPRELRLAVVEASQGKVGTAFDRVILRCFKYDPASRKYHFYVMGALRLGSGAFAVALAVLLGALWSRYRRRSATPPTPHIAPALWMEALFVGTPLIFFTLWFFLGFREFVRQQTPPSDSMDVYVAGKKWMWKFAYPDGPNSINVLRVPA